MFPHSFFILSFFCSMWMLHPALSIQCNENQYPRPFRNPTECCNKCPPGHFMTNDPDSSCQNKCEPCIGDRYMETHNVKTYCKVCDFCSNPNMEHKSNCTATQNTVCGCKAGYQCKDQSCTMCEEIPTTIPTLPPPTTTGVSSQPKTISKDTVWFLAIIALLCAGIVLLVATKIKPLLRWVKFRQDFQSEKAAGPPLSQEDGEVSKPIQEMCRECDQLTDLCVKI